MKIKKNFNSHPELSCTHLYGQKGGSLITKERALKYRAMLREAVYLKVEIGHEGLSKSWLSLPSTDRTW